MKNMKKKRRIEEELKQRRKDELNNFKQLLSEARRHREVVMLHDYLDTVEKEAIDKGVLTIDLSEWLQWARKKTEWYNPNIELEDQLLENVNRDTLEIEEKKQFWGF